MQHSNYSLITSFLIKLIILSETVDIKSKTFHETLQDIKQIASRKIEFPVKNPEMKRQDERHREEKQ